jgi:hypothetical protein
VRTSPQITQQKLYGELNKRGQGFGPAPSYFAKGYADYIKGPIWRLYREQYFTRHAKVCRICSSPLNVQLHHLNHQNYMSTQDRDYVALCATHHAAITRGFKSRRDRHQNMRMYTIEYIATHRRG